jgi:glycerol-3-phosphate acyltransferase PlsY
VPDPISWAYSWPYYLIGLSVAYLIGSIPVGLLLTHFAGKGDIRSIGSGNIGATNVLRTGSKKLAATTLLLDIGKGSGSVLIGLEFGPELALIMGGGSVIGHIAPIWLLFRGGKGVATTLGVLIAIDWRIGLTTCTLWILTAAISRYSSLAALIALGASPGISYLLVGRQLCELACFLALLILLKHLANIKRLLKGKENKIILRK